MKIKILMMVVMMASVQAFAQGSEKGNGGLAVKIKGKYYLLDLVEEGVHEDPFILKGVKPSKYIQGIIEKTFKDYPQLIEPLGNKFAELAKVSPLTAEIYAAAMNSFEWKLKNEDLEFTKDAHSALKFSGYFQVAVRKGLRIRINTNALDRLANIGNQVATVFHEIGYSLSNNQTNSDVVRELDGFLFRKAMSTEERPQLYSFLERAGIYHDERIDQPTLLRRAGKNNWLISKIYSGVKQYPLKHYYQPLLGNETDISVPLTNVIDITDLATSQRTKEFLTQPCTNLYHPTSSTPGEWQWSSVSLLDWSIEPKNNALVIGIFYVKDLVGGIESVTGQHGEEVAARYTVKERQVKRTGLFTTFHGWKVTAATYTMSENDLDTETSGDIRNQSDCVMKIGTFLNQTVELYKKTQSVK